MAMAAILQSPASITATSSFVFPNFLHKSSSQLASIAFLKSYPSSSARTRTGIVLSPRVSTAYSNGSIRCQASAGETSTESSTSVVYPGFYGPWSIDSADVREVISYRSGLVTAAASFVIAASSTFFRDDNALSGLIKQNIDILYVIGAGGLGLSLFLIHIYVTEIKRTLQALWGLGALGSFAAYICLAQPAGKSLAEYVVDNPTAVWFVGPLFASLTGLVFKEGLCYGKLEAGILTFVIPSLLLGHLTGLMDDGVKGTLLGVWMVLFVIFAGRKFTQPIKDDIGDKSVFIFNALGEDEKKALIMKLEQQKLNQDLD
ncbi:uncharacterized protein LOC124934251 [Impatiens glandulifera]|uniref:uncharacterized protein LOC124934251 n=1 Tax=Impatiens glandulifera TaxID=253017 RepID=UPI001FB186B5|nr:uncharacterized protein LOC124934251 [Impatiens glandulifera]